MSHNYKLRYKIEIENREEGYSLDDASDEHGLTDALLAFSIIYEDDGSYSQCICCSANGKDGRHLSPNDIFKLWVILGLSLDDRNEFSDAKKIFLKRFEKEIKELLK